MKIKCFKCKGKGWYIKIDWFCGVLTLGMTALMNASDRKKCDVCEGKGYIKQKIK